MKILFICYQNAFRSQIAEILLKDKIRKLKIKGVEVFSCGLKPVENIDMDAVKILRDNFNIHYGHMENKKGMACDNLDLDKFDHIISMTPDFKNENHKIIEWNIPDPYQKGWAALLEAAKEINKNTDTLIKEHRLA